MQICPLWNVHTLIADGIARSRSASAKTMLADLPPSSSSVRLSRGAAACWIARPTGELPVNEIMSTSGAATSASPMAGAEPETKLTTPGGSSEATIRQSSLMPSGSTGGGFTTTVLPQASAGPIFPAQLVIGKLNGLMQATTPTGSRTTTPRPSSGVSAGSAASSAYRERRATTDPTCCVSATPRSAPVSAIVSSTRPGISARNRSAARLRHAPRSPPDSRGQGPRSNASRAARAAVLTCASEASGARPASSSVAGSITGYVPPSAATQWPPISTLSKTGTPMVRQEIEASGRPCLQGRFALTRGRVDGIRVELRQDVLAEGFNRFEHVLLLEGERQGRVDELIDADLLVEPDHARDLVGRADLAATHTEAGLQGLGRGLRDPSDRAGRRHPGRARNRVEPVEEELRERLDLRIGVEAARLVAILQAEHVRRDGDVVVDEPAGRLGASLDAFLVCLHERGDLRRRAEREAECTEPELARFSERRRARAREPHRRVRLREGLRQHVPLGHAEVLALEAVGPLLPHAGNLLERFLPHGLGLGRARNREPAPLRRRRPPARAELDPPLGEMVHGGDPLGDARWVVHRRGQVADREPDVDAPRPRRDPREEDLGRRLVRVVEEEVVLGRPVVLEAGGVAGERHVELPHEARVLVVPRRNVHLRKDPEFHRRPPGNPDRPRIRCSELPFANASCQPFFRVVALASV